MKLFRFIFHHPLFRGSFILFLGSVAGSFLNYFFHVFSGRLLSPADYGVLESFFALLYILSVFTGAISLASVRMIGALKDSQVRNGIRALEKKIIALAPIFSVGFLIVSPLLVRFLHVKMPLFYITLAVLFFLGFWGSVYGGAFSSRLRFEAAAGVGVFQSAIKLALVVGLLLLGWQLKGVFLGMILSSALGLLFAFWMIGKFWPRTMDLHLRLPGFWHFSFLALGLNFLATSLYSTDILLVKHFFSSSAAGLYASASVSGKAIFFAATMVLGVAYPLFVKYQRKPRQQRLAFWLTLAFIAGVSVAGIIFFTLFPQLWLSLLYGQRYSEAAPLLPLFALFMGCLAILNLLMQFTLARKDKRGLYFMGFAFAAQIIFILLRHQTLLAIITDSLAAVAAGLLLAIALLFPRRRYFKASQPVFTRKSNSES